MAWQIHSFEKAYRISSTILLDGSNKYDMLLKHGPIQAHRSNPIVQDSPKQIDHSVLLHNYEWGDLLASFEFVVLSLWRLKTPSVSISAKFIFHEISQYKQNS